MDIPVVTAAPYQKITDVFYPENKLPTPEQQLVWGFFQYPILVKLPLAGKEIRTYLQSLTPQAAYTYYRDIQNRASDSPEPQIMRTLAMSHVIRRYYNHGHEAQEELSLTTDSRLPVQMASDGLTEMELSLANIGYYPMQYVAAAALTLNSMALVHKLYQQEKGSLPDPEVVDESIRYMHDQLARHLRNFKGSNPALGALLLQYGTYLFNPEIYELVPGRIRDQWQDKFEQYLRDGRRDEVALTKLLHPFVKSTLYPQIATSKEGATPYYQTIVNALLSELNNSVTEKELMTIQSTALAEWFLAKPEAINWN